MNLEIGSICSVTILTNTLTEASSMLRQRFLRSQSLLIILDDLIVHIMDAEGPGPESTFHLVAAAVAPDETAANCTSWGGTT